MIANHQPSTLNPWTRSLPVQAARNLQHPLFGNQVDNLFNVLVINSDLTMHTPLYEHLAHLDYYVHTAEGCEEALHLLTSKTIALVLLNIRRPVKDSLGICTAVRKYSEVPILILTDLDQLNDAAYALIMGADGYITHPFTLSTLKIRLRGLLNSSF